MNDNNRNARQYNKLIKIMITNYSYDLKRSDQNDELKKEISHWRMAFQCKYRLRRHRYRFFFALFHSFSE